MPRCFKWPLFYLVLSLVLYLQGCSWLAHTNNNIDTAAEVNRELRAKFKLDRDRGTHHSTDKKTLFILALSGGGSRAAYWSAASMLKLQSLFEEVDLLKEVDAISSISGGSMAAAYYAISADAEDDPNRQTEHGERPLWTPSGVKSVLGKNYIARWIGNWFWPHNFLRFWFTAYDRTDIMAETLSDNLYDTRSGHDFTLAEINPERPNLILNATISSSDAFGNMLTFTEEDFQQQLCSDVSSYEIGRAVMGSASFPAAFNSMTLRDYSSDDNQACQTTLGSEQKRYVHIIDGGSHDNLGLLSAVRFLKANDEQYDRMAVLLIDAYTPPIGVSNARANPRGLVDYMVDTNFMDSVNTLMNRNRFEVLSEMMTYLAEANENEGKQVEFYHATFDDIAIRDEGEPDSLKNRVNTIKSSLQIGKTHLKAIDDAVNRLFVRENPCLQNIVELITGKPMPMTSATRDVICRWSN